MNELLEKYISELDAKINRTMKQYNLTKADVSMGNAAQIRGYVIGLRDALNTARQILDENQIVKQALSDDTARKSRTRRSRVE